VAYYGEKNIVPAVKKETKNNLLSWLYTHIFVALQEK